MPAAFHACNSNHVALVWPEGVDMALPRYGAPMPCMSELPTHGKAFRGGFTLSGNEYTRAPIRRSCPLCFDRPNDKEFQAAGCSVTAF
eukprot:366104-Chlamydomonas_euryale.AAC.8